MEEIKRIKRELVANGSILDYCQDTMLLPNGKEAKWDILIHHGAAAVVPVLDDGRIVMVRQYRNTMERFTWEIPAGGLNNKGNEPTDLAAIRELSEETGYVTNDVELLLRFRTSVAYSTEVIDIYVAHNLSSGSQHLDPDEYVDYKAFTLDELCRMIFDLEIEDSKTIAAILAYKEKYINN
ncbi:MAG: NUDIX hydrolase [Lachnospiraceae bacterium]|nr:NUDIX hydrolase [Lachnospiraceae bacterium]